MPEMPLSTALAEAHAITDDLLVVQRTLLEDGITEPDELMQEVILAILAILKDIERFNLNR